MEYRRAFPLRHRGPGHAIRPDNGRLFCGADGDFGLDRDVNPFSCQHKSVHFSRRDDCRKCLRAILAYERKQPGPVAERGR